MADPPPPGVSGPLAPPPVDSMRVIGIGTGIWLVAFVALLPWWSWLGRHDHRIWLWTCLAGFGLGLIALVIVGRHKRAGRVI
jgi:hypothetical protein